MPELPEVTAIADFLDERMAGLPIRRVDVASLAVLKTADPPYTALVGRTVASVGRIGKYLVITTVGADDGEPLHLVIHLSRAGWVRWSENLSPTPPRPGGKGPIALRVHAGLPGEG
ncbi:MAG: Fpg/Nei family DNA glycosylase, partial [Gordonia sp. (in: high G+C Gram-positive bacteria)]